MSVTADLKSVRVTFDSSLRCKRLTACFSDTEPISTEIRTIVNGQIYRPNIDAESDLAQCIISAILGLPWVVSVTIRSESISIETSDDRIRYCTKTNRTKLRRKTKQRLIQAMRRAGVSPVIL
jgi:hypothetical protein